MNYIRFNLETNSYSFRYLHADDYMNLTSEEKVEYLEQQMLWLLDEDQEKLEELMKEAKMKALLDVAL